MYNPVSSLYRSFTKAGFCFLTLFTVTLLVVPVIGIGQQMCTVYCPDGSTPNVPCDSSYDPCGSSESYESTPYYDDGAAQRAMEAELERQRQAEALERLRQEELENQRLEAEQRRQAEESERQARLIRDRNELADSLKGLEDSTTELKSATTTPAPAKKNTTANPSGAQAEIERLQAREQELVLSIERDMQAINNLGFSRRAEDFAAWEKLAADAKTGFENEVKDAITDAIAAKAQDQLLAGIPKLDKYKMDSWIAALQKTDPPPTEIIAALRRLGGVQGKDKMIEDAKYILTNLDRIQKLAGSDDGQAAIVDISQDMLCGLAPPPLDDQCNLLKTETKLTIASLYNNAARRVAMNEVNRLTELTEDQLKALQKLDALLKKHTRDRNLLRQQITRLQKP